MVIGVGALPMDIVLLLPRSKGSPVTRSSAEGREARPSHGPPPFCTAPDGGAASELGAQTVAAGLQTPSSEGKGKSEMCFNTSKICPGEDLRTKEEVMSGKAQTASDPIHNPLHWSCNPLLGWGPQVEKGCSWRFPHDPEVQHSRRFLADRFP